MTDRPLSHYFSIPGRRVEHLDRSDASVFYLCDRGPVVDGVEFWNVGGGRCRHNGFEPNVFDQVVNDLRQWI